MTSRRTEKDVEMISKHKNLRNWGQPKGVPINVFNNKGKSKNMKIVKNSNWRPSQTVAIASTPGIKQQLANSLPPIPDSIPTNDEIVLRRKMDKINSNRICIINQPQSIEDILFCEPIVKMYYNDGYKIVWPVESSLRNINKHFPYITFVPKEIIHINYDYPWFLNTDDLLVVPLQWASKIMKSKEIKASKYYLHNLPVNTWKTTCWERDMKSENELFTDILQLSQDEKYNLINNTEIIPENGLRNVYVENISDFTVLDWGMVIEKATNIYTTNGYINYILEKTKNKNVSFFPNHRDVTYQF